VRYDELCPVRCVGLRTFKPRKQEQILIEHVILIETKEAQHMSLTNVFIYINILQEHSKFTGLRASIPRPNDWTSKAMRRTLM